MGDVASVCDSLRSSINSTFILVMLKGEKLNKERSVEREISIEKQDFDWIQVS